MPTPDYIRHLRERVGHAVIMMPTVAAVIRNGRGEVLLHQRGDDACWGLPGGAIEPGEEPAQAVIREVYEETGLRVVPERLVGVYGGYVHVYPNGDQAGMVSITFACRVTGGALRVDGDESLDLRCFPPDALPENMVDVHRVRIEHAVTRTEPYFNL